MKHNRFFTLLLPLLLIFFVMFGMAACSTKLNDQSDESNSQSDINPDSDTAENSSIEIETDPERDTAANPNTDIETDPERDTEDITDIDTDANTDDDNSDDPGDEPVDDPTDIPNGITHYNYRDDYQAEEQGKNGWYYTIHLLGEYADMTSEFSDAWNGNVWVVPGMSNWLTPTDTHPSDYDSAIRFKIPYSGDWSVSFELEMGNLTKDEAGNFGSDGICYIMMKNGEPLYSDNGEYFYLYPADPYVNGEITAAFKKGDMISLHINKNGHNACDGTYLNASVDYKGGNKNDS